MKCPVCRRKLVLQAYYSNMMCVNGLGEKRAKMVRKKIPVYYRCYNEGCLSNYWLYFEELKEWWFFNNGSKWIPLEEYKDIDIEKVVFS